MAGGALKWSPPQLPRAGARMAANGSRRAAQLGTWMRDAQGTLHALLLRKGKSWGCGCPCWYHCVPAGLQLLPPAALAAALNEFLFSHSPALQRTRRVACWPTCSPRQAVTARAAAAAAVARAAAVASAKVGCGLWAAGLS